MSAVSLAWELFRSEGPEALWSRWLDRREAARRRRSYQDVRPEEASREKVSVLNVLPTAPRPDWGGVQVQLLKRLEAEAAARPVALLYPDGDGFRVETRRRAGTADERREAILYPAVDLASAVRGSARHLGASIVHFEQLVGFELRSVAALVEELRTVVSVHDFGLFCRRPHLIERPAMGFCGFSRDAGRCARCLSHDAEGPDVPVEAHRATAASLLGRAAAVVYPSEYLRRTYAELFPGLDATRQHVLPPPAVSEPAAAPAARGGPIRHLAYVGSVQAHKGATVFEELVASLSGRGLRFTVYGGGEREALRRLRRREGVRIRGYYRAGELPRRLRSDGVDLALLLSIWPETYGLTLDECLLAGVPVAAFDHGAIAERVRRHRAGVLADPATGAAGIRDVLEPLLQRGFEGTTRGFHPASAPEAADACRRLYRAVEPVDSPSGG